MKNEFNKVYLEIINEMNNNLIKEDQYISFAHGKDDKDDEDGITNDVLTDKRVKLLKKWGVYIPQKINKEKTDLTNMLTINQIQYEVIYDQIITYKTFQKLYPGIDKTTCKLYTFSKSSRTATTAIKKAQKNPKALKNAINSMNNFKQDNPLKVEVHSDFIACYITQDKKILKPNNVDDTAYLNACKLIAGILTLSPETNKIGKLQTVNGKDITTLVQKQVKKIQQDKKLKEKYEEFVQDNLQNWSCQNETTAWGKQQLQDLINFCNKKIKSGETSDFLNFEAIGISISKGSTTKTIAINN